MINLVAIYLVGSFLLAMGIWSFTPAGRMMIATAVADAIGWSFWVLIRLTPTVARLVAKFLIQSFEAAPDEWAAVVAVFTEEIGRIIGPGGTPQPSNPRVAAAAAGLGRPLAEAAIAGIAPNVAELRPEDGTANLERLFNLTFTLGMQGWWTTVVGDLASLGRFGAAFDLPDAVERGLGLSRIGRLAWRTPVKKAIAEPLEELYNRRYAFKKLTISEATQLWHKGQIGDETFLDVAAASGYSHDRAVQLLTLGQRFYDLEQIRILNRFLGLPDALALDLLREAGYTSGRDKTALEILQAKDREPVLRELASQARRLYQAGRLTQGELQAILEEAKFPRDEVGIILATEDLLRAEQKQLTVGEIQTALRDGALDPGPARARLKQLGYQNEDVDILLSVRGKQPSAGQIIDAVVRGRITPEAGRERLEREGYSPADAELLISLRARRLSEGQVLDALRQGLISASQGRTDLQALGFVPDAVDVLLAFLQKRLSPADVQAAVLRGLLTAEAAEARLIEAGYSRDDAALLVALRRRLLTTGEVLDAFEDGFITRVEALGDLQARGLSSDDALVVVRIFEERKAARQKRAAARPPARPPAPPRRPPPSGGRRGTGGPPPAPPPP